MRHNIAHIERFDSDSPTVAPVERVQMIEVDGHRLALTRSGQGSPTIVLETGLGAESDDWAAVQRGVAALTTVCRYDRAGRGASDRAPTPRSALDMVGDLRQLLRLADVPRPYVLVGQSFGGLLMRLYAHRHRDEVAGLVLVDSMHEEQFEIFGPMFPAPTSSDPPALNEIRRFWTDGWRSPASTVERIDFPASLSQGREIESLGDLPLQVITAGTFLHMPMVPPAIRPDLQRRWEELQRRLVNLSSSGSQSFVRPSGHFVQRDNPAIVVDAITALLSSLRQKATSPWCS